jgi:hypothetical protein
VQYVASEEKKVPDPDAIAVDLGLTKEEVLVLGPRECWNRFRRQILDDIESAGNNMPPKGDSEPGDARGSAEPATEPSSDNKPATGLVVARGRDEPDHDKLSKVERLRQSCDTLRAAAALGAGATIMKVTNAGQDADVEVLPVALG